MIKRSPPSSAKELLQRAQDLAGKTLGDIAAQLDIVVPPNLTRHKGWPGQLIELALGATAGSKPEPDFEHLGIELKTIPINTMAKPLETTFVCVAPLTGLTGTNWQSSHLKRKMAHVLWVPIIAERAIPVANRIIATPFYWCPDKEEEAILANDWQQLTDMIVLGNVERISGKHGDALQLRPKAANSKIKTQAFDAKGKPFLTLPRGFYLRTQFTEYILRKNLIIN